MIDELRFRTLLPGKTNLTDVVQSALKLFGIYVNRERSALRTNVLRVGLQIGSRVPNLIPNLLIFCL